MSGARADFWRFWAGQTISQLGSSFTAFALPLLVFELTAGRTIHQWESAPVAPRAGRAAAVLSLVLWIAVIFTGRMIGFTTSRAKESAPAPVEINLDDLFGK